MLACQHTGKTRTAKLLSASSRLRPAGPLASSRIHFGAVAHEEKNSGRRYRRHVRETAYVAARRARIRFGSANGAGRVRRQIQAERARLELLCRVDWFARADAQRPNRKGPKTFGQRLDPLQFCTGARDTRTRSQRRSDASAWQLPWRANAFSGTWHRLGLSSGLGQNLDAARARRSAVPRWPNY